MDLERWSKKTQYLTVDSAFVKGTNSDFSVYIGNESNVFIQEMRDVVGLKLVDFFASNVQSSVVKYIDVISGDIPLSAQILDERNGQIFARIMNERDFDADVDKHAKIFTQKQNLFNPISIKQLAFRIYEWHTDGSYVPLDTGTQFHMIIEITTLDHLNPPVDNNYKLINAIDNLVRKIDEVLARIPKEPPDGGRKKINAMYLFAFIASLFGFWMWFSNRPASVPVMAPMGPAPVGVYAVPAPPPVPVPHKFSLL